MCAVQPLIREIAMDEASLNALMNEHVFVGHDPPVKKLQITLENGVIEQKCKLDKAIDNPSTYRFDPSDVPEPPGIARIAEVVDALVWGQEIPPA